MDPDMNANENTEGEWSSVGKGGKGGKKQKKKPNWKKPVSLQTFINDNGGPSGYNPGDMVGLGDRGDSPNYTLELSEDEEIIKASLLQFFTDLLRRLGPVKKDE